MARGQTPARNPTPPKVPFNNQPCQSLAAADQVTLKMNGPLKATPGRAPGNLTFDNVCSYDHGGTRVSQIGYMTKGDYDLNGPGNRSTTRQAPTDLPGAFYDDQGGLWIAKNGYYVVVSGRQAFREPVARLIAGKL
jgi:hypothetical protein